jgi:hypothetical protein
MPPTTRRVRRAALAAGAGLGVGAWLRSEHRRARLRSAVMGIRDAVLPTESLPEPLQAPLPPTDEAHAPGHARRAPPPAKDAEVARRSRGSRPWMRHKHRWHAIHH